jgi:hypothetical protein
MALLVVSATGARSMTWPWESGPWPRSSDIAVQALDHPSLEDRAAALDPGVASGFRFVAFGDQRALADGEWQEMLRHVASVAAADDRLLFILDTGDIVNDGKHADQFAMLTGILSVVPDLAYVVGVGNHEVSNNRKPEARRHTAAFLDYLDDRFSPDRMYYRKDVGPVRFLFLDTNDLTYGDEGERGRAVDPPAGSRAAAQMEWLFAELADTAGTPPTTIAVLHHPFVQTSRKHREQARALWRMTHRGRRLVDALLDGGVDVVLTGHTHTYERFHLRRLDDGRSLSVVNLSGRPRASFLWIGDGSRRPRSIAGGEREWLRAEGWDDLDRWEIVQEGAMTADDADQFAVIAVEPRGGLSMDLYYLDASTPDGLRRDPAVRLK